MRRILFVFCFVMFAAGNMISAQTVDSCNAERLKQIDKACRQYVLKSQYDSILTLRLEALNITQHVFGKKAPQYGAALKNVINGYDWLRLLGNIDEKRAKELFEESSKYTKEWIGLNRLSENIENEDYQKFYCGYARDLLFIESDTVGARDLLADYSKQIKERYGDGSELYYNALDNQKDCFCMEEQVPYLEKMLEIAKNIWGEKHLNYQTILLKLSVAQQYIGNVRSALELDKKRDMNVFIDSLAFLFDGENMGVDFQEMQLADILTQATLNSRYGNWNEANQKYRQVIYKLLDEKGSPLSEMNFFSSFQGLVNNFMALGRMDSVIIFGKEIVPQVVFKSPKLAIQLLIIVNNACHNSQALNFIEEILTRNSSLKAESIYPNLLESMAETYGMNRDVKSAMQLIQEAYDMRGQSIKDRIRKLVHEEIIYMICEDYSNAFRLNREVKTNMEQLPDYENTTDYQSMLMRSCLEGSRQKEYQVVKNSGEYLLSHNVPLNELHSFFDFELSLTGSVSYVLQIPQITYIYVPLIDAYCSLSLFEDAKSLLRDFVCHMHESIYLGLSLVGPSSVATGGVDIRLMGTISQNVVTKYAAQLGDDSICALAYDDALLTKQIQLNASDNLRELILSSGDDVIKKKFGELIKTQSYMDNAGYMGWSMDSLLQRKRQLEIQLNLDSKLIGDYTKKLSRRWNDVQKKLHPGEYAVEFTSYEENDEEYYYANILSSGKTPEIIYICSKSDLGKISAPYTDASAANLVWGPIVSKCPDAKRFYFSPVGILHVLGIENFVTQDGSLIAEQYELYRLSSTSKLIETRNRDNVMSGVIYGGLFYDADLQAISQYDKANKSRGREVQHISQSMVDSLNLRGGVSYLPSTKTEVEYIGRILAQSDISITLLQGDEGSEGSFKSISGGKVNFLHVATHGFYWNERESQKNSMLGFISAFTGNHVGMEDKAMTRSGLLFAGANNALFGKFFPANVDDGILTAREISELDLRNIDLVVLSACQTGLGEVMGDGVWGLQRGFKKAGANTLLMSLWKVDDVATQKLMTRFYANLMSGMNRYKALREAQRYVREYEIEKEAVENSGRHLLSAHAREQARMKKSNRVVMKKVRPYANPKYWAAFILLDAID